jgi:hypothetical protein
MVSAPTASRPRFILGRIVATPGALAALQRAGEQATLYLCRHSRGDWGAVCGDDWKLNDRAVAHEGDPDNQSRVLSAYATKLGEKLWIVTEADRGSTCILLPQEF